MRLNQKTSLLYQKFWDRDIRQRSSRSHIGLEYINLLATLIRHNLFWWMMTSTELTYYLSKQCVDYCSIVASLKKSVGLSTKHSHFLREITTVVLAIYNCAFAWNKRFLRKRKKSLNNYLYISYTYYMCLCLFVYEKIKRKFNASYESTRSTFLFLKRKIFLPVICALQIITTNLRNRKMISIVVILSVS